MIEAKGSVKLFGVTIKAATQRWDLPMGDDLKGPLIDKALNESKTEEQQADSGVNSEPAASSIETEHNEMTLVDEEHTAGNSSKSEEKQDGKSNIQEKPLQKPTEILPCPRCHSLDTKFCYFNNYNVSQPRHFCKACQRYWTDGGTMRNMAVGAGRRKSKSSISQYKHTALFGATLQSIPSDILITFNHPEQEADGAAPTLGSGMFPFKTNEHFLNLNNKTTEVNCNKKACEGVKGFLVFRPNITDRVHNSSGPFRTYPSSTWERGHEEPALQGFQAYKLHAPSPNRVPFSSQWNPGHAFSTPYMPASFHLMNSDQKKSGMSASFEPTALEPMTCITTSTSSSTTPSGSAPTSMFNKHLRDGSILRKKRGMPCDDSEENSQENGLRMPTRIDDPNEAAKSSTWTTMRNKGNASDGFCFRGLSHTSQPKVQNMDEKKEISDALHANPSAWLRSLEFHENIQWRKDRVSVSRQS